MESVYPLLVLSIITVFVARGGTQRGTNDTISTEILNQADSQEEAAAAEFPVTQENPEE